MKNADRPILPWDSLSLILSSLQEAEQALDRAHSDCFRFGAKSPVYRRIAEQKKQLQQASTQVVQLYENQFPQ